MNDAGICEKKNILKKGKAIFLKHNKRKKMYTKIQMPLRHQGIKIKCFHKHATVLKGLKNFFRKKVNALLFFTIKFSDKHYIKLRKLISSRKLHWYWVTFLTYTILVSFSDILNTDKIKNGITRKEKEKNTEKNKLNEQI